MQNAVLISPMMTLGIEGVSGTTAHVGIMPGNRAEIAVLAVVSHWLPVWED